MNFKNPLESFYDDSSEKEENDFFQGSVFDSFDIDNQDNSENKINNNINIVPLNETTEQKQSSSSIPTKQPNKFPSINNFQRKNLVMTFVGFKYETFCKKNFSIEALILAEYYLFYRRMNILALIILLLRTAIFIFINPLLSFIFNIILAFTFNKLYLNYAKYKVDKLISSNQNIPYEKLRELVLNAGEVKPSSAISAFIINALVSLVALIIISAADVTNGPFSNFNIFALLGKNPKFDGQIQYEENVNINKYYEIVMPEDIKNEHSNNTIGGIKTNPDSTFSNCSYKFNVLKNYTDAKDLANQMSKYYNTSKPQELQINSITWYYIKYETNETVNVYLTSRNKRVYMYEFISEKDSNLTTCDSYNESIINSTFYN